MLRLRSMPRAARIAIAVLLPLLAPAIASAQSPHDDTTLRVTVYDDPPFTMQDPDTGAWRGLALDLWHRVADRMGVAYTLAPAASSEEALEKLARGDADVVAGAVPITLEGVESLEFTTPFLMKRYSIATPPRLDVGWSGLLQGRLAARFREVLAATFVLLVGGALVVWWLERRRNPDHFGGSAASGIGNALWWSATTMSTVGYGDRTPVTRAGRVFAVFVMFVSLILVSVLTGIIASRLTVVELRAQVTSLSDLARVRVGCVNDSPTAVLLHEHSIRYQDFPSIELAADALVTGRLDAIVGGEAELHYIADHRHPDEIAVLPGMIDHGFVAYALPQGSPLRRRINAALQAELESPDWMKLHHAYFHR